MKNNNLSCIFFCDACGETLHLGQEQESASVRGYANNVQVVGKKKCVEKLPSSVD